MKGHNSPLLTVSIDKALRMKKGYIPCMVGFFIEEVVSRPFWHSSLLPEDVDPTWEKKSRLYPERSLNPIRWPIPKRSNFRKILLPAFIYESGDRFRTQTPLSYTFTKVQQNPFMPPHAQIISQSSRSIFH